MLVAGEAGMRDRQITIVFDAAVIVNAIGRIETVMRRELFPLGCGSVGCSGNIPAAIGFADHAPIGMGVDRIQQFAGMTDAVIQHDLRPAGTEIIYRGDRIRARRHVFPGFIANHIVARTFERLIVFNVFVEIGIPAVSRQFGSS